MSSEGIDDFAVSLRVGPHRANGHVYIVAANGGKVTWASQSEQWRERGLELDTIDHDCPHDEVVLEMSDALSLSRFLTFLRLPALPRGNIGLGGTEYVLEARHGSTLVRWAWWSELPSEWAPLVPLIAFLEEPTIARLDRLRSV